MALHVLFLSLLLVAAGAVEHAAAQTAGKNSRRSFFKRPSLPLPNAELTSPPWSAKSSNKLSRDELTPPRRHTPAPGTAPRKPSSPTAHTPKAKAFIVQLKTPSAAAHLSSVGAAGPISAPISDANRGVDGFRSIRPGRITAAAAAASTAVMDRVQAVTAAAGISNARVTHRYSYALSGFAVRNLTATELQALAADPNVLSVVEDNLVKTSTFTTPKFLGLTGEGVRTSSDTASEPQYYHDGYGGHHGDYDGGEHFHSPNWGLWDKLGGVLGPDGAGEDVLIGVIDTGIWMPNIASFKDNNYWHTFSSPKGQSYSALTDFKGVCSVTEGPAECNNKVVGCRYYTAGWGGDEAIKEDFPYEHLSCKDAEGHGSHVSGTAAGNYGTQAAGAPPASLLSGMAPRARIASYKVFWGIGDAYESDVVSAVEDAIKDGVDIINYSASGSPDSFRDALSAAFMNAARAGVLVAAAAGNDGKPNVNNIAPWLTTVAASTHDRQIQATLSLGDGTRMTGAASLKQSPVGPLPLLYAKSLSSSDNFFSQLLAAACFPDYLDANKVPGDAIIACDRGGVFIVEKAEEVLRVGGKAMVLMNVPGGGTEVFDALDLGVPYVHVLEEYRNQVVEYAQFSASPSATISAPVLTRDVTAPAMASLSSTGPVTAGGGVVLAPSITAPGVSVLAATTDNRFEFLDGTSMSTPHIAGIAALLKDNYPSWSPMAIKSAIMTTAYQTTRTGTKGQPFGNALNYGAGHVDPSAAMDPALVFDSNYTDWQRFLCAVEPVDGDDCATLCDASAAGGSAAIPCDVRNFNVPWVSSDSVVGALIAKRTLTSVLSSKHGPATFTATGSADPGSSFDVEISPRTFHVGEYGKQQQTVTIKITANNNTPAYEYQFGQVVWRSNRGHTVRIPLVLKFETFSAPARIAPTQRLPEFTYTYKIAADAATTVALTNDFSAATVTPVESTGMTYGEFDGSGQYDEATYPGVGRINITVPPGNTYFAVAIFSADVEAAADIDLIVKRGDTVIGVSEFVTASELLIAESGLAAGEYTIVVPAFNLEEAESATVYVHTWMFPSSAPQEGAAAMQVSPSSVLARPGDPSCCPITLSFSNLDFTSTIPGRYIGFVAYSRADGKEVPVRTAINMLPGF